VSIADSVVRTTVDSVLTWDYARGDTRIAALYDKARDGQWHAVADIDWSLDVPVGPRQDASILMWRSGVPETFPLPADKVPHFAWETHVWLVSQFLHGEQGALLSAARLVEVLPDMDAKLLAASQVIDEARHVEVYARYLDEKVGTTYPANPALEELLRQILADPRWDLVCLGMQIIVEGLALAGFRLSAQAPTTDALIVAITDRIARDEARHVSFGMMSLQGFYDELTAAERRDREEFVLDAARLMSQRFELPEVWERLEVPAKAGRAFMVSDPGMRGFRQVLFSRVNASIARLGLMTPAVRQGLVTLDLYKPVLGERRGGKREP